MSDGTDLIAAGYVLVPSRGAVARVLSGQCGYKWEDIPPMSMEAYLRMADAVLALLRGETPHE